MKSIEDGHDIIDQYLSNQLSEDRRTEFEIQILENAELLKEVQLREAMKRGLKSAEKQIQQASNSGEARENNITRLSPAQWVQQPMSMAACLVMAVGVLALLRGQESPLPTNSISDLSSFGSSVVLETLRGSENRIVALGLAPILISIDVGPVEEGNFSVELIDDNDNNIAFSVANVRIDQQGWLRLVINRELVGNYTVRVAGAETELSYLVRFSD